MKRDAWMETFSGEAFYPLDPQVEDVRIIDIAHALALTCRYNGHCSKFYSVAEHCTRMSIWMPGVADPRWLLLHDAAEAYLADLPTPIKNLMPEYKEHENRVLGVIMDAFSLPKMQEEAVKQADLIMLATECRDLMRSGGLHWNLKASALPYKIDPWTPEVAEKKFLARATELGIGGNGSGCAVLCCPHDDEERFRVAEDVVAYVCRKCAHMHYERECRG